MLRGKTSEYRSWRAKKAGRAAGRMTPGVRDAGCGAEGGHHHHDLIPMLAHTRTDEDSHVWLLFGGDTAFRP